jgi:hypothetical protein
MFFNKFIDFLEELVFFLCTQSFSPDIEVEYPVGNDELFAKRRVDK